ncbi:MAG: PqqD family protein [Candidatus Coatesbacteria bacterium]|nr:MAG: PqqD family protein [Candidatus Coatesbacteria bacterium]
MDIELLKGDLVARRVGDEYFLLTTGDAMLHNIRESGVFIFEAIEKGAGRDEILDGLVEEFNVEKEVAAADLDAFLRELEEKGIITLD